MQQVDEEKQGCQGNPDSQDSPTGGADAVAVNTLDNLLSLPHDTALSPQPDDRDQQGQDMHPPESEEQGHFFFQQPMVHHGRRYQRLWKNHYLQLHQ